MARPTCPKCDSTSFEVQPFEPTKSTYRVFAVNCTKCGAVVSVLEYYSVGKLVIDLGKKLGFDLTR